MLVLAACPSEPPVVVEPGSTSDGSSSTGWIDMTTGSTSSGIDTSGADGSTSDGSTSDGSTSDGSTSDGSTSDTSATEPICGDGIAEGDEACDDAGESATCNDDCTPAACGDGLLNTTAAEQCDDAGESATCDGDCTPTACGDGLLNATAGEPCDDGGESATCNVDCTPAVCGDGVFNASAGEQCDDAGPTPACDLDCTLVDCGDGLVSAMAGEECDDAGESAACNSDCTLSSCGDGITNVTAGEACDDASASASCNSDCSFSSCGDGVTNVIAGEACDDAGVSATCDVDCTVVTCGDLLANPTAGELCDGTDLAGATCEIMGFSNGTLACDGGCGYDTSSCNYLPGVPVLTLEFSQVKQFDFSWAAAAGAEYYQLLESPSLGEPFGQVGGNIVGEAVSLTVPLCFRLEASYVLRACNTEGCTDSASVSVVGTMAEAVGYFKASNTNSSDRFGTSVALSADGLTLAVGAPAERSNATGIDGNQADNSAENAGAVYVFVRDSLDQWTQQAYVKPSNTSIGNYFGWSLALSDNGDTLAVGALSESSNATGIDGNQADDSVPGAGAVYVFTRNGMAQWAQQAYVKASNTEAGDQFSHSIALSGDGSTLAVGARGEDSGATGIDGNQADDSLSGAGAVYVFVRNELAQWAQQAYVKASNTEAEDGFGHAIALSGDGETLAVGARLEDSSSAGIDGNQANNGTNGAGAVYVFVRDPMDQWTQQAYVKASSPDFLDEFGHSLALSEDGDTLAVGAPQERSNATGIDGNEADDSTSGAGAVYVFVREPMDQWTQQAYVKASNTDSNDHFGWSVALGDEGSVLAIGAYGEDAGATGVGGDQIVESAFTSGAVYVLVRDGVGAWSQQAFVKASNSGLGDRFGWSVALSGTAGILAVGAEEERSQATGISGDQTSNLFAFAGAVYLY